MIKLIDIIIITIFIIIFFICLFVKKRKIENFNQINNDNLNNNLTIGIKTFSRPNALNESLNNIVNLYNNINIIVADDSLKKYKNENKKIIEKCKKINKNITYLNLPFDIGISEGRNQIVKNTKTKYLLVLDDSRFVTKNTNLNNMLNFIQNNDQYDLIAGIIKSRGGQHVHYSGKFYNVNDKKYPIEIDLKKIHKKIENNQLDNVYDTDITLNVFIAKTDKLKKCPWRKMMKIGEHELFFYDWFKKQNKCAICLDCNFNEIKYKNKIYGKEVSNYRAREKPGKKFDRNKLILVKGRIL